MDTWQWQSSSTGSHFLNINIDYNLAYTWGGQRMLTLYFKQDWIQNSCALYFFCNCCQTVNNLCCTNRNFQHVVVTLLSHSIQLCLTASCADSPSDMLLMNKIRMWQNQSASGFITRVQVVSYSVLSSIPFLVNCIFQVRRELTRRWAAPLDLRSACGCIWLLQNHHVLSAVRKRFRNGQIFCWSSLVHLFQKATTFDGGKSYILVSEKLFQAQSYYIAIFLDFVRKEVNCLGNKCICKCCLKSTQRQCFLLEIWCCSHQKLLESCLLSFPNCCLLHHTFTLQSSRSICQR